MKALITGAAGFVGGHLIECLRLAGWEAAATRLPSETLNVDLPVYELDILNPDDIKTLLASYQPDCVFHLAAQSSVKVSWTRPTTTVDINVNGAINLLQEAITAPIRPRILLIGSSEEYGKVSPEQLPVNEETPLRPDNVYAASKAMQGMLGRIYADAYGLETISVRAFNHIGPGQSEAFALSGFCKQAAMIEAGLCPPVIKAGNLDAKRDFTDVRDIVEAYRMLAEKGQVGSTYNVGSGKAVALKDALSMILSLSTADITVEQDPSRMRPSDVPVMEADVSRLSALTGWRPRIPLETTLSDMLEYWRNIIGRR